MKPPLKPAVRTCVNKRRYTDEPQARAAGLAAIENNRNASRLFVYRCPVCRGWHLTRAAQAGQASISEDDPIADVVRTR